MSHEWLCHIHYPPKKGTQKQNSDTCRDCGWSWGPGAFQRSSWVCAWFMGFSWVKDCIEVRHGPIKKGIWNKYPLVNKHSYGKWPIIVDFSIEHDFPIFSLAMLKYQRVIDYWWIGWREKFRGSHCFYPTNIGGGSPVNCHELSLHPIRRCENWLSITGSIGDHSTKRDVN